MTWMEKTHPHLVLVQDEEERPTPGADYIPSPEEEAEAAELLDHDGPEPTAEDFDAMFSEPGDSWPMSERVEAVGCINARK